MHCLPMSKCLGLPVIQPSLGVKMLNFSLFWSASKCLQPERKHKNEELKRHLLKLCLFLQILENLTSREL